MLTSLFWLIVSSFVTNIFWAVIRTWKKNNSKKQKDPEAHHSLFLKHFHDISKQFSGVCGVVVIILGNGHGEPSSNPKQVWLHDT